MVDILKKASGITDIVERHRYVFNSDIVSPGFFDLEGRMKSEEFEILTSSIHVDDNVVEIGCLTGLNSLGLSSLGYKHLTGLDFVPEAIHWARNKSLELKLTPKFIIDTFPCPAIEWNKYDKIILFDVLEHIPNIQIFLEAIVRRLTDDGEALILVPEGRHYYDCGHIAFFPDKECLVNILEYHFKILGSGMTKSHKIFVKVGKKDE